MNERQRELKRKYQADQRAEEVTPMINCLECEHERETELEIGHGLVFWCLFLRGSELHRSVGPESVDYINAPKACPKRRKDWP